MPMFRASDGRAVSRRIITLPRVTAVAAVVLLVSATISLAADKPSGSKPASHKSSAQQVLVVPDVQGQLFVFASGMLEDGGFGWHVRGSVHGFPANRVVSQSPKPEAQTSPAPVHEKHGVITPLYGVMSGPPESPRRAS